VDEVTIDSATRQIIAYRPFHIPALLSLKPESTLDRQPARFQPPEQRRF
jgi:hypothetical protein